MFEIRKTMEYYRTIMSELWIPQPDKTPDIENLFDMMLLFQEQIDGLEGRETKIYHAMIALRALSVGLKRMDDDEKRITLVTGLAVIDDTEEAGKGGIVEHVGIDGLIEDVHCIQVGERVPISISLGIDAFTIFPSHDPEDADHVFSNAKTPISRVSYIEHTAA